MLVVSHTKIFRTMVFVFLFENYYLTYKYDGIGIRSTSIIRGYINIRFISTKTVPIFVIGKL